MGPAWFLHARFSFEKGHETFNLCMNMSLSVPLILSISAEFEKTIPAFLSRLEQNVNFSRTH